MSCCCCTVLEYSNAVFASWVLMCVYIFQSIKPYLKSADHSTGFSSRLRKPPLQVFRFPSLPVGLQLVPNLIKNFIEHYSEHTQTELRHLSLNQALSVTQPAPCAIYRFQAYWNLSYMFCLGGALCSPCCRRPWTFIHGPAWHPAQVHEHWFLRHQDISSTTHDRTFSVLTF